MRILMCGGIKTQNIVNAVYKKFEASGDEFVVVEFIEDINDMFARGDYFDKALITETGITHDGNITDMSQIRSTINRTMQELRNKARRFSFVFLTEHEEMAEAMYEETLDISDIRTVILRGSPYQVSFFVSILVTDVKQIPKEYIYVPEAIESNFVADDFVPEDPMGDVDVQPVVNIQDADDMDQFTNGGYVENDFGVEDEMQAQQDQQTRVSDEFQNDMGQEAEYTDNNFQGADEFQGDNFQGDGYTEDGFQDIGEFQGDGFQGDGYTEDGFQDIGEFQGDGFQGDGYTEDGFQGADEFQGDGFQGDGYTEDGFQNAGEFQGDGYTEDGFQNADEFQGDGFQNAGEFQGDEFQSADGTGEDWGQQYNGNTGFDDGTGFSEEGQQQYGTDEQQNIPDDYYGNMDDQSQQSFDGEDQFIDNDEYKGEPSGELPDYLEKVEDTEPQDNMNDMDNMDNMEDMGNMDDMGEFDPAGNAEATDNFDEQQEMDGDGMNGQYYPDETNTNMDAALPGFDVTPNDEDDMYGDDMYGDVNQQSQGMYPDNNELGVDGGQGLNGTGDMADDLYNQGYPQQQGGYDPYQQPGAPMDYEQTTPGMNIGAAAAGAAMGMAGAAMMNNSGMQGPGMPDQGAMDTFSSNQIYQQMPQQMPMESEMTQEQSGRGGRGKRGKKNNDQSIYNMAAVTPMSINNVKDLLKPFANRGNSIVVTGCGGSGTSTVAFNLANLIAQIGYTVLLVDMDVRGRTQSYISKFNYNSMEIDGSNLMAAINSSTNINNQTTIAKTGFHLLTMGLASDVMPIEEMLHKEKLARFASVVKTNYNFIIYDMPFDVAVGFASEITYMSDNVVMVTDASNWGITKMMLHVCNIDSDDMQDVMFSRAQILFNKYRNLDRVFGLKVRTADDILKAIDRKVLELIGDDVGLRFSNMSIAGIVNDDPMFEAGWYEDVQYSDTKKGQDIFIQLLENIVLKKH